MQTLADSAARNGGSWSQGGLIVFVNKLGEGLAAIRSTGGVATPVTTIDRTGGDRSHGWPHFLPDGRHFLYFVSSNQPEERGLYVGSVDSKETRRLLTTDFKAAYAPPGYLLFVRGETLMAQPFDAVRLELSGEPVPVADGVWTAITAAQASFSALTVGSPCIERDSMEIVLVRSKGNRSQRQPRIGIGTDSQLARDGKRIAIGRGRSDGKISGSDADGGTSVRFWWRHGKHTDLVSRWQPHHVSIRRCRRRIECI